MKKTFYMSAVLIAAFAFSPSALAREKREWIEARGFDSQKAGIVPIVVNGTPRALSKAMENAVKAAHQDAKDQCDALGGKLRQNFTSKNPPVQWFQIGKEFEATVQYRIECVIRVAPERDPAVSDRQGLKPDEVMIDGEIYIRKGSSADAAR